MKLLKISLITILSLYLSLGFAQMSGDLDPDFGDNGRILTDYNNSTFEYLTGIMVQQDGKIVASGMTVFATGDIVITRYHPDGSLDTSFGENGYRITDLGNGQFYLWGAAVQQDDKILVCGSQGNSMVTLRYTADGDLDFSFGSGGIIVQSFSGAYARGNSLAIQEDGKIVVAGFYYASDNNWQYLAVRYLSNGNLDASFGTNGIVIIDAGGSTDNAYSLTIQDDNKILLAGQSSPGITSDDVTLVRLNENGSTDLSFGTNGIVHYSISLSDDKARTVTVLEDGKILIGATAVNTSSTHTDVALIQLLSDGTPDLSFGNNGVVKTSVGTSSATLWAMQVLNNGNILTAGSAKNGSVKYDLALIRYLPDGSLDNTFSGNGISLTDFNSNNDYLQAMTIQPDAKILGAGRSDDTGGNGFDALVVRFLGDDSPDYTFDSNFNANVICNSEDVLVELNLGSLAGFDEIVTLSVDGLPLGAEANFTPSASVVPPAVVNLELSFDDIQSGVYSILIHATSGTQTKSESFDVTVVGGIPSTPVLSEPVDGTSTESLNFDLIWDAQSNSDYYQVQVAENPSFTNILIDDQFVPASEYPINGELLPGIYYWRIKPANLCGTGNYSETWAFQIKEGNCQVFESSDIAIPIASDSEDTIQSNLLINDSFLITDLKISTEVSHSWPGDLIIKIKSPQGTELTLMDRPGVPESTYGCGFNNLNIIFDDEAILSADDLEGTCNQSNSNSGPPYAIEGSFQPFQDALSVFENELSNGNWVLTIFDVFSQDGGMLETWNLEICSPLDTVYPILLVNNIPIEVNNAGSAIISEMNLMAQSEINSPEDLIFTLRSLPENGNLEINGSPVQIGSSFSQAQINDEDLSYIHNGSATVSDSFKFDVLNAENIWLPNQFFQIDINSGALSVMINIDNGINCFGLNDGQVSIEATGGISPYEFSIDGVNFQSSNTFSGLEAGIYQIAVKDAENNLAMAVLELTQPDELILDILVIQDSIQIGISGGTAPFMISLDNGNYQLFSDIMSGLEPGVHTLRVLDTNGCTDSLSFEIKGVAIQNLTIKSGLQIFPNPSSGVISIHWEVPVNGKVLLEVFDVHQKRVVRKDIDHLTSTLRYSDNWSHLPPSSYMIRLSTKGVRVSQWFIIQ